LIDLAGLGALALVAAEWLAVGRLSGLAWPGATFWAPRWSLYLLSGAFLVGLAELLLAVLGVGFSNVAVVLVSAAVAAALVRLGSTAKAMHITPGIERRERYGWLLLGVVLLMAMVRALVVPEAGWDAYSHWGLKAQAFALSGSIVDAGTVHEYYPPLVPLLEAWLYLHRGAVSIDLGKTIWPLVGSAFALCLAWHLRLALRRPWLAPYFATGIVLGTTQLLESFWTGQADLALTAFLTLAALAVWQWLQRPDRRWLIQAALFGAAAALTKYEGLPRVGVVVAAVLLVALVDRCRSRAVAGLVFGAAAGLAYVPWLAFRWLHGISGSNEHVGQFQPQAIGPLLATLAGVFAGVRTGGGVLIAILAWAMAGRRLVEPRYRLLTLVVAGQLLATLVAFLISDTTPDVQARTSATRLVEHFLPLALFAAALWLDELPPIIRPGR
jgi:hypothetical protein